MAEYFTDREHGSRPRNVDEIDQRVWGALRSHLSARIQDGSFGYRFPEHCPDGNAGCGCDEKAFERILVAEVPWIDWPLPEEVPETPVVMDLLEFCAAAVGEPVEGIYHSFFRHHHLRWDREAGLERFVADVNRLFARNGIVYELISDGTARRILPQPFSDALRWTRYRTGDDVTERLLEKSASLIKSPKIEHRQDALEKLWDAFERIKTLESGANKKAQADALLDRVAAPGSKLRAAFGTEAAALTGIGNTFRIRHSETSQEQLTAAEQIDYFFLRMFSFLHTVLHATARLT